MNPAARSLAWSPPCSAFVGFRFPAEVIVVAVRCHLRYGQSYRDVEELLAERGVEVDHVTVYRWVQRFTLCWPMPPGVPRPRGTTGGRSEIRVASAWMSRRERGRCWQSRPIGSDDAEDVAGLSKVVGFRPATEIILAAATNGDDYRRLLARLAIAVARRYRRLIDLTGPLPVPPPPGASIIETFESETGLQRWWAESRTTVATLPRNWSEVTYNRSHGRPAIYHVVDADLLTAWLEHPRFRMVK